MKVYRAVVKDNKDPTGAGRIRVFAPNLGGDPTNPKNWILCQKGNQMGGNTPPTKVVKGSKEEKGTQDSYGTHATGFDLETEVFITVVNGQGFYLGAAWQEGTEKSTVGFPSSNSSASRTEGYIPPGVENNRKNAGNVTPNDVQTKILERQGLNTDLKRGLSSSSIKRDTVSQVLGLKTRDGNRMILDDGFANNDINFGGGVGDIKDPKGDGLIALKTKNGTQIYVDGQSGFVYLVSSDAKTWFELSNAGINIYTAKTLAQRADAGEFYTVDGNVNIEVVGSRTTTVSGETKIKSVSHHVGGAKSANFETSGKWDHEAGEKTVLTAGKIALTASGELSDNSGNSANSGAAKGSEARKPQSGQVVDRGFGKRHPDQIPKKKPKNLGNERNDDPDADPAPKSADPAKGESADANLYKPNANGLPNNAAEANITPEKRALLDAISQKESGGAFDIQVGKQAGSMKSFADHPREFTFTGGAGASSAAGAYQITKTTWDGMTNKDGRAFDPKNQTEVAAALADQDYKRRTGRDLQTDLENGDRDQEIAQALNPTWTSLPGGREGSKNTGTSMSGWTSNLNKSRKKFGIEPVDENDTATQNNKKRWKRKTKSVIPQAGYNTAEPSRNHARAEDADSAPPSAQAKSRTQVTADGTKAKVPTDPDFRAGNSQ